MRPDRCVRELHFKNPDIDQQWLDTLPFDQIYCLPLKTKKDGLSENEIKNQNVIGGNIDFGDSYFISIQLRKCSEKSLLKDPT